MNRIKESLEANGMSQTKLSHRLDKSFNTCQPVCGQQGATAFS